MKQHLIYFFCICLPLVANSSEKTQGSAISHQTCQIQIYSNFNKLIGRDGNHVQYDVETKTRVESLFTDKGYKPVTLSGPNIMSFDVSSIFSDEQNIGSGPKYLCWHVEATICSKDEELYSRHYLSCRDKEMAAFGLKLVEEKGSYSEKIYYNAVYDVNYYDPNLKFSTGFFLSNAIDAVLLGGTQDSRRGYKEIPTDIGILKKVPYCCTPNDNTQLCLDLKENKKN